MTSCDLNRFLRLHTCVQLHPATTEPPEPQMQKVYMPFWQHSSTSSSEAECRGVGGGGEGGRRRYAGNVQEVQVRWLLMALPDLQDLWRITSSTMYNPADSFSEPFPLQQHRPRSQTVQRSQFRDHSFERMQMRVNRGFTLIWKFQTDTMNWTIFDKFYNYTDLH